MQSLELFVLLVYRNPLGTLAWRTPRAGQVKERCAGFSFRLRGLEGEWTWRHGSVD